jgi:hypothetical protein
MSKTCEEIAEPMANLRAQPGGYIVKQQIDEIAMCHSDILKDLETLIDARVNQEEIYRTIARMINKVHKSDKALIEIRQIYEREKKQNG